MCYVFDCILPFFCYCFIPQTEGNYMMSENYHEMVKDLNFHERRSCLNCIYCKEIPLFNYDWEGEPFFVDYDFRCTFLTPKKFVIGDREPCCKWEKKEWN